MIHEHKGHRARMREKLERYGTDVFTTYELLEMLLYNVIPVRDTKPLAKRLLNTFGSADALFHADKESVMRVEGMGARGAELICAVGALGRLLRDGNTETGEILLDGYAKLGDYLWRNFYSDEKYRVVMLSLDSRMMLIGADELYSLDYSSAAVRPSKFMEIAMRRQATAVVIAHTHPNGAPIPSEGDRETNKFIAGALEGVGVALLDHYVLAKGKYLGFMTHNNTVFRQDTPLGNFISEKRKMNCRELERTVSSAPPKAEDSSIETKALAALLSHSKVGDPASSSQSLLLSCGSLIRLLSSELYDIECASSKSTAHLIKIAVALIGRQSFDKLALGKRNSRETVEEALYGLFFMKTRESVYAIALDGEGRATAVDLISEGTVSMSGIVPRRLLEVARLSRASSVILAHNHPSGISEPSNDDLGTTTFLRVVARDAGFDIAAHYIVAGKEVRDILPLLCETEMHHE